MFRVAPPLELKKLETIFRHKALRMLLSKGKITEETIRMLSGWKHTGFNVFCGNRISPTDDTAMENLARYIIRASFSQERMQYLDHLSNDNLIPSDTVLNLLEIAGYFLDIRFIPCYTVHQHPIKTGVHSGAFWNVPNRVPPKRGKKGGYNGTDRREDQRHKTTGTSGEAF
jgi:hypothetical protein